MTQEKETKKFAEDEFRIAITQDMNVPGFAEAYLLARKALLSGAQMFSEDDQKAVGEECSVSAWETIDAVRDARGFTDLKTWTGIVSSVMGSLIGKEDDGKLPVPYGWRWAADIADIKDESIKETKKQKTKEEKTDQQDRHKEVEKDPLSGKLRNFEKARADIAAEAAEAARIDFGREYRSGGHGIVIITSGGVRMSLRTEPLSEESAKEITEAAQKALDETGEVDIAAILDSLSKKTLVQVTRVVEDNAVFHGYDPSETGSISTRIFRANYFSEMVKNLLEC